MHTEISSTSCWQNRCAPENLTQMRVLVAIYPIDSEQGCPVTLRCCHAGQQMIPPKHQKQLQLLSLQHLLLAGSSNLQPPLSCSNAAIISYTDSGATQAKLRVSEQKDTQATHVLKSSSLASAAAAVRSASSDLLITSEALLYAVSASDLSCSHNCNNP